MKGKIDMRNQKTKSKHNPVIVYILTRTGVGFNEEGIQAVRDLVLENGAPEDATGILAFTGRHLLRPNVLLQNLKEDPNARVVLSINGGRDLTLCGIGQDPKGMPGVIDALENGTGTSWEILTAATGWKED